MQRIWPLPFFLVLVGWVVTFQGCRRDAASQDAGPPHASLEWVNRAIPGTPLEIRIPKSWTLEAVSPAPLAPPPTSGDAGPAPIEGEDVRLQSRVMLSARAPEGSLGDAGRPWLMVLHDPHLPRGITSSDYLLAQRASNQGVAQMEHVEAERSRRQGRPSYHVRDEWDAPVGERSVRMSQEALLLLDAVDDTMNGYAIVLTMTTADRQRSPTLFHRLMEGVRFGEP